MDLSATFLSGLCFWRGRRAPIWALAIALATVVGAAIPRQAAAQFQDVGYTFEPTVQGIFEDDAAVFENDPLYGGALGLNFGRHFQVSAEYLANRGLTAHLSNLDRFRGLLDRDLDLRRYGGRVRFNLYDRRVIPYLTAGTGILQFDPAGAELSRTIYGIAGGGHHIQRIRSVPALGRCRVPQLSVRSGGNLSRTYGCGCVRIRHTTG